ncbi:hypothetical protein LJ707_05510 [Mucilaginibacter sp. UR6-1]|uniref:hypothetical protein n=1 Tax=Mucilaginibacter sp. UR6-1 TaxID=1435643 RepID=UPI001E59F884|nr:hypothetical protein [Mucilaginibacter sp. UR6-1]MCC8408377.1 hypothetical protein [Mucilaginibacter sp. UR6-1]
MSNLPDFVKSIDLPEYRYKYSICTLVTQKQEYTEMLESFIKGGFDPADCEFLIADNSAANKVDAYTGLNSFLQSAKGEYIILCHQDILLTEHSTRSILQKRINEMDALHPNWAVLGNAGAAPRLYKKLSIKISYPNGFVDVKGKQPARVCSVDENFMVVKNAANLALSGNIGGYHLYGLDICMTAEMLGYTCHVIDFLLIHKSLGNIDYSFDQTVERTRKKYALFFKGRYLNTTIATFYISGSAFKNRLYTTKLFKRIFKNVERINVFYKKLIN